ncbi:MAG TPA: sulfite dehydrogenase [Nitrospira sp.]|nr:sulfite dehydrogenase [Nitrospira sp.]
MEHQPEPDRADGPRVSDEGPGLPLMPPLAPIARRRLLARGVSLIALASMSLLHRRARASEPQPDPMRVPGSPARTYGERSAFESARRAVGESSSLTPLQDLHGIVTPSALHFERHHNGVPTIDPSQHRLLIHGLVARPLFFTVDELMRFPSVSRLAFVECAGNSRDQWGNPQDGTVQELHGLTSTSEWTGVKLVTLLDAAGAQPDAAWLLAEGGDAAGLTRSIPLTADVLSEAMVCYGQNGEALRPEQGYPLRLLLPGFEGNINVKWLRRLKLGRAPFMTRWETAKYTDLMPDGTAYQFSLVMEAKSIITSPSGRQQLRPGIHEIRGLAWSGRGRVVKVDVTTDGGRTWRTAELQEPVLSKCHTRFRLPWVWDGQEAVLQSRCVDETGYRQPSREALIKVRGTHSSYHYNGIQSWKIDQDGRVRNIDL